MVAKPPLFAARSPDYPLFSIDLPQVFFPELPEIP